MKISTRSYCYLLLWFGFIVICAQLTPYFANDYRYLLISGTQELVTSLSDIFVSQYHHYFEWGGRTVAHVIAQFLLFMGKPVSAVSQAVCYVLLILFVYYNAYGIQPTLKLRFKPLVLITILLFLQLRAFGEVVFNIVSSANYLYTLVLVLIFLLPYRISMSRTVELNPVLLSILVFVLGILAGWSNESTAAAVATGLGLYLMFNLKRHKLRLWQCCGYLGFLIGFALLIFAPGNHARFNSMEEKGFDYFSHMFSAAEIFGESLLVCGLLVVLVAFLAFKIRKYKLHKKEKLTLYGSMWFIATGFFSLVLMIFSPNFPIRSTTTFVVFTIIGILGLALIVYTHEQKLLPLKLEKLVVGLLALFTFTIMGNMIWAYSVIHENMKVRYAEMLQQKEQGQQHLVVTPLQIRTYKYMYVADVRGDKDYWTNKLVATFYQVQDIVRTKDLKANPVHYDWIFYATRLDESSFIPVKPAEVTEDEKVAAGIEHPSAAPAAPAASSAAPAAAPAAQAADPAAASAAADSAPAPAPEPASAPAPATPAADQSAAQPAQ